MEQPKRTSGHVPDGEPIVRHPLTRPVPARVTRPIAGADVARPDLPDFVTRAPRTSRR